MEVAGPDSDPTAAVAASSRTSPRRRRLTRIVVVVAGLVLLRFGVGLVSAWYHYSNTPEFETFIADRPVAESVVDPLFDGGELLSTTEFQAGPVDPRVLRPGEGEYQQLLRVVDLRLLRGDDLLLSFTQEYRLALRRDDGTQHGIAVGAAGVATHPGLRCVAEARLYDLDSITGGGDGKGGVLLDLMLVAGAGASRLRIGRGDAYAAEVALSFRGTVIDGSLLGAVFGGTQGPPLPVPVWRLLSGIPHNLEPLPEEGLAHRVQWRIPFDLHQREDGGRSGPGSQSPSLRTNTEEYSFGIEAYLTTALDGAESSKLSTRWSRIYRWGGEVW